MNMSELKNRYFGWMVEVVHGHEYSQLLHRLSTTEFGWTVPLDANRADDGVQLRYRFGRIFSYPDYIIASELDDCSCSILEMMVALAIRCEETIMHDQEVGDRTARWFWDMLASLGLQRMTDEWYDDNYVNNVINRFLNREYEYNGAGGLFTVSRPRRDMRSVEIWYQMNWYLDDICYGGLQYAT